MSWNDDDFESLDFEADEPDEATMEEIRLEDERIRKMPLKIQARHILELTDALVASLPDDDMAMHYKDIMLENAMILEPKIAGAEGADLYTLRMENAVFIKVAARNLLNQGTGLGMMGLADERYLKLLSDEIEKFRLLFVEWVKGFDQRRDIPDNWGLFNDPMK